MAPASARFNADALANAATASARVAVEAVRAALEDLAIVCALLGLEVRSARGGLFHCPFHADPDPSFSLFRSTSGGWAGKCHGCGVRGDALALIAQRRGYETRGADFARLLEDLAAEVGIVPGAPLLRPEPPPRETSPPDDSPARRAVQDRIHRVLLDEAPLGDEGRAYLRHRGLEPAEIPGEDWGLLPPPGEQRRLVEAIVAEIGREAWLELSGLAKDAHRFAHPQCRLVIPWRAAPGVQADVALLQRRRLDEGRPKYVGPGGLSAPWPFGIEDSEIIGDETVLVLCEGALDVLALRALNREDGRDVWVLGIPGTSSWRPEWAKLGAGRDVIVALDGDAAGDAATAEIFLDLEDTGARVTARAPIHGKDWLETLRLRRAGKVAA